MVGYNDGMEVNWGCWLQGGTCHNDKPGLKCGDDRWLGIKMGWKRIGGFGNTAGPATMTSRAIGVSRKSGDDGKDGRRDLPQ